MRDIINAIYQNLQNLQLQPTDHNVMLLADCLLKLKDLYQKAGSAPAASEELDPVIRVEEEGEHGEDGE
jgi:hypothetical protein